VTRVRRESIKFNVLLAPDPASPLLNQTTRTDEFGLCDEALGALPYY